MDEILEEREEEDDRGGDDNYAIKNSFFCSFWQQLSIFHMFYFINFIAYILFAWKEDLKL